MRAVRVGRARVRYHERFLWALVVGANLFGAAVAFIYGLFFQTIHAGPDGRAAMVLIGITIAAPMFVVAVVGGRMQSGRHIRRAMAWIAEDREATADERGALFRLPMRLATISSGYWLVMTALGVAANTLWLRLEVDPEDLVRGLVGLAIVALVPWSLSFLLVERALGPVYAEAVAEEAPLPETMGIPARLVLAWSVTSGVPIVGIVLNVVGLTAGERAQVLPLVLTICAASMIAGVAVAIFSGWAIAGPLRKVQAALRAVEGGDLDVHLSVSEAAELGELQVSVNRMVLGLRERERMRELFGHHVGPEVAAHALDGEATPGGERVDVTGMFVDVIASSKLAEEHSPEEVVVLLNAFFDTVVRCVGAEGGFVNKFEGDGALCVFGAPVPQDDHADRALRAARALRSELQGLRGDVEAAIGISSGQLVAGNIGSADRYEYTIIGDAVNEAARLSDEAKRHPSRVLVSARTIDRARAETEHWTPSGELSLRGRAQATPAYELASTRPG